MSELAAPSSDAALARLGAALQDRYRIERELGHGGMAAVYLAEDVKHRRKVALKVLKPELAAIVGADRFLAEIQTTANLQHPHILPLFDSGQVDGFLFYVMPYVNGESLRDRLDREKQLPVSEAVRIATAVANALEHAHRLKVIHRDIKPENILLQDGEPVVADFGIALAVGAAGGGRLTETGLSLGTPYYMSPEQAMGDQHIGPQADVYALGCVLYEMLVGEPPHAGGTAQAVLGKIIAGARVTPTAHRPSLPANVDAAIRRALEKIPADRFVAAQDFAKALAEPGFRHGETADSVASTHTTRWKRAAAAAAAVAVLATLGLGWSLRQLLGREPALPSRFDVALPKGAGFADVSGVLISLSPDGRRIVYVGEGPGGSQLWQRTLDDLEPHPIPGTGGALDPAVSPDGSSVAFDAGGSLKTVSLQGGLTFTVVPQGVTNAGADWGPDGMLYFQVIEGGIQRVPAKGGQVQVLTRDGRHHWADALPGGGALISIGASLPEQSRIAVLPPDGGEPRELLAGTMARYAKTGHIVYATAAGTLMAVPFDAKRLEVTGPSVVLLDGIRVNGGYFASQFALSDAGTMAYKTGVVDTQMPVMVERDGRWKEIDPEWMIARTTTVSGSLSLSPDGRRLALSYGRPREDLWIKRLDTGTLSRFTTERSNQKPSWSPDGNVLTFIQIDSTGVRAVRKAHADGTGETATVLDDRRLGLAGSQSGLHEAFFSPDGEWLICTVGTQANLDIVAMHVGVDSTALPLVATRFEEYGATLSPDARWLAYTSNETGQYEIYVRPFPLVSSGKWTVSTGGGLDPMWAHSGRELFYRNLAGKLVAAQIQTTPTFSSPRQETLFALDGFVAGFEHPMYDVSPDDRQFVMLRSASSSTTDARLIVVQNFSAELKEKVGR